MRRKLSEKRVKAHIMKAFLRFSVVLLLLSLNSIKVNGQIGTFEFSALTGDEVSAAPNFTDANLSISNITRGAGITGTANGGRFNANNWTSGSIANAISGDDYMEFTLTPNGGCDFTISSIVIQMQRSGTGPSAIALRSSVDGYTANLDTEYAITDNTSTQTFTFTFTQSNISSAATYRIYMYAEAGTGTGGPGDGPGNDIIINGSTSCSGGNSISTGVVSGGPFTVNCSDSDAGSVAFTSTGTFNTGNIFTVQLSDASGIFGAPVNIGTISGGGAEGVDPSGNILITIPAGTVSGSGYRIRIISSNPSTTGTDNGTDLTINYTACSITAGVVNGAPYDVDCVTGDVGSISFTSIGTFAGGNVFTAQLSDATGDFTTSTNIGTLSGAMAEGSNPAGTINYTIPSGTVSGNSYRIRIVSSDLSLISNDNGSNIAIILAGSCTPPHIKSVVINACNPTCLEGLNEIIFGSTGNYSVEIVASDFEISYGTSLPATNYTDVLVNNATKTVDIGTAAGCAPDFIDAVGTTIPANSNFIICYNDICLDAFDWTGLCGSGPIYLIYQNDPSWVTSGTFKNGDTGGLRYFNSTITTTSLETFSIDYNYNANDLQSTADGGDGGYVMYGPGGGSPTYGDDDCFLSPILLPIEMLNFEVNLNHNGIVDILWSTASEHNTDYFIVEHSTDGKNFTPILKVQAAGNSYDLINYSEVHRNPSVGVNYYHLKGFDFDGSMADHGVRSISTELNFAYYDAVQNRIVLNEIASVEIYSLDGKLVLKSDMQKTIPFNGEGIFLIVDPSKGFTQKIAVH